MDVTRYLSALVDASERLADETDQWERLVAYLSMRNAAYLIRSAQMEREMDHVHHDCGISRVRQTPD